jgi:hypothetical protein
MCIFNGLGLGVDTKSLGFYNADIYRQGLFSNTEYDFNCLSLSKKSLKSIPVLQKTKKQSSKRLYLFSFTTEKRRVSLL